MGRRLLLALALLAAAGAARADESEDFGVAATESLRLDEHAAPTPLDIPGAKRVTTAELFRRLARSPAERPLLFDVVGDAHASLPGAIWLPGAGRGDSFDDLVQARLAETLAELTRGDRGREMVFFCAGERCWLSYNAALRAVRLGYTAVGWYRGGVRAWTAAGHAVGPMPYVWRRPDSP